MAAEDGEEDKQFEPSQKKLDDARAKGEVPRSTDLATAASYAGFLVAVLALGPGSLLALGGVLQSVLQQADSLARITFSGSQTPMMGAVVRSVLVHMAPWFAIPASCVILVVIAQRAFVVAPTKLVPKLNRISPLAGFKNKFGRNGIFEFLKSTTKLIIYIIVLSFFLRAQMDRMIGALYLTPGVIVTELGRLITMLLLIVLIIAFTLGAIDFLWQRAEHLRKHRMSRKEMMDELKNSEGDPMMKQQRRQKGVDIAMNKMLVDVPTADVVIVNPTHFAVALRWDRQKGSAPVCVAKGTDEIAAKIRELAQEHAIPIHSDPPTARALHAAVNLGQEIAPEHYQAVAAAIRFAESIRTRMKVAR